MESIVKARHRHRSKLERRQIVEETLKPGASVARIARAHNVNANQVFGWRKLYRDGRLEVSAASTALLPVEICGPTGKARPETRKESAPPRLGTIDIDLGHARLRIEGAADPDCVRAAVEGLRR